MAFKKIPSWQAKLTPKKFSAVQTYIKLAKRADQRLVRLERYKQREGYKNIDKYAYAKAMRDIRDAFGSNVNRFNQSLRGKSISQIEAYTKRVETFLNSQSSTLGKGLGSAGIKSIENRKENTFNDNNWGISWEDALALFESGAIKKYEKYFDSGTIVKLFAKQKKSKKDFDQMLSDITNQNRKTRRNPEEFVKQISNLKKQGKLNEEQLLKYLKG